MPTDLQPLLNDPALHKRMSALEKPSTRRMDSYGPYPLYLSHGGIVLCHRIEGGFRLAHCNSGQSVELHGSFAHRMQMFLSGETDSIGLATLTRHYPWLAELEHAKTRTPASRILLGNGLGMLFIELTDRCNEHCIHCYAESSPECSEQLDLNEIRHVLEDAHAFGNPAVQFTGGDPLIHPDIVDAVATARDLRYKTLEIYTNGLALSDAVLKRLLPYQPNFAFSVYSHDATVHDRITQVPGSLSRTMTAIRRAQDSGLVVRIGIILMAENKGQETDTIRFLQDELLLETGQIGIDVVRSTGRGQFMQDYQPDLTGLHGFGHRPDMPNDSTPKTASSEHSIRHRGKLCVSASGNVYPCIFSRQTKLGNIHEQPLEAIMQTLEQRILHQPSQQHWQQCQQSLSCSDCQAIAYALGEEEDIYALA